MKKIPQLFTNFVSKKILKEGEKILISDNDYQQELSDNRAPYVFFDYLSIFQLFALFPY